MSILSHFSRLVIFYTANHSPCVFLVSYSQEKPKNGLEKSTQRVLNLALKLLYEPQAISVDLIIPTKNGVKSLTCYSVEDGNLHLLKICRCLQYHLETSEPLNALSTYCQGDDKANSMHYNT